MIFRMLFLKGDVSQQFNTCIWKEGFFQVTIQFPQARDKSRKTTRYIFCHLNGSYTSAFPNFEYISDLSNIFNIPKFVSPHSLYKLIYILFHVMIMLQSQQEWNQCFYKEKKNKDPPPQRDSFKFCKISC